MQNLMEDLLTLFKQDDRFIVDGQLLKSRIVALALELDSELLALLMKVEHIKSFFFSRIENVLVFDKVKFQKFIMNKNFLADNFTQFTDQIGFAIDEELIAGLKHLELVWPHKDCVLEGGQEKATEKRKEIFYNETLAPDEIDRILSPKALTNFELYDFKTKKQKVSNLEVNENYLVKGNNLQFLHTFKSVYADKVKLIYIDPPYNTGKDSFGYNDTFNHSTWLTFMKNRLDIAKEYLTRDGVIFISIDVNEHGYLKVLCDSIFKRQNFVGEIVWETATDNNATQISMEHEYILVYAKDIAVQKHWSIRSDKGLVLQSKYDDLKSIHGGNVKAIEKDLQAWLKLMRKSNEVDLSGVAHYRYVDEKGVFYPGNSANTKPGDYFYDIRHPISRKVCRKPDNGYRWPESTFLDAKKNGEVVWGKDETTIPRIKKRLDTASELFKGYFYEDNRKSTKELTNLMGRKTFDNPKSLNLLKKIVRFTTSDDDIVLDFFAGSGTTAQAVLEVNDEDGGARSFILCEQMDYVDDTKERIRKVLQNGKRGRFIYAELAKANERFVSKIRSVTTTAEGFSLWEEMQSTAFLSYRTGSVITGKVKEEFDKLNLRDVKSFLMLVLDKNMMYVPFSEIEDTSYHFSAVDKGLNVSFRKLGE